MDLTEDLKRYIHWDQVKKVGDAYFITFEQNERMKLKNIRASGPDLNPTISFLSHERTSTFYLVDNGEHVFDDFMTVPIVFDVVAPLRQNSIAAVYQHWTFAGWLHREQDKPAYKALYNENETGSESEVLLYFELGVRHREGAPSMELYRQLQTEKRPDGSVIRTFGLGIQECSHVIDDDTGSPLPDPSNLRSWPYVRRLTLRKGRQLFIPTKSGLALRELAAKTAEAKWAVSDAMTGGIYPTHMVMQNFHEFWKDGQLEARRVKDLRSKWIRIKEDDQRPLTDGDVRVGAFGNAAFDKEFMHVLTRVGLTNKPFYDDNTIEFAVLTGLFKDD